MLGQYKGNEVLGRAPFRGFRHLSSRLNLLRLLRTEGAGWVTLETWDRSFEGNLRSEELPRLRFYTCGCVRSKLRDHGLFQ